MAWHVRRHCTHRRIKAEILDFATLRFLYMIVRTYLETARSTAPKLIKLPVPAPAPFHGASETVLGFIRSEIYSRANSNQD
jgi:hypothetical protein